jgi:FkbH-like protein
LIIIFQSTHKLVSKYSKLQPDQYIKLADDQLADIDRLCATINSRLSVNIIYYNYPEIDDAIFGSYANKVPQSFVYQLRKLNYQLMDYASRQNNFYICDLSSIQNQVGKAGMFQTSVYINTEMVLSIDVLPMVAAKTVDLIGAMNGKVKKCLIIDLDNTMWGGIIGDDGLENIQIGSLGIGKAFTEFQYWVKKLKNRGIIIAVCSKNTESVAMEVFNDHPDMVLHAEDIGVFMINWDNKADNIRKIQSVLNIGFDSMVFLDDNPFERNMVRENIPGITVPELPVDPADYLEYLYTLNLFETVTFSNADAERTKQYQVEAKRAVLQTGFTNEDDFLKSLHMVSLTEPFNKFNTPRVAQLSQRSNQFNLRTTRYTEQDIEQLCKQPNIYTYSFTLEDEFGDNGLISIVIMQKENTHTLFIETWLMSCRVLKRGMENYILNTLVNFAKQAGYTYLKGQYLPTAKNAMVKDHYQNLGFSPDGDNWLLDTQTYQQKKCFIEKK